MPRDDVAAFREAATHVEASPDLTVVWEQWQAQRADLLHRLGGDDRLTSFAVSVESSLTGRRRTPWVALIVPGIIGFLMALTGNGAILINIAVFGATISYVLMMLSHIVLRRTEPDLDRPYRTPGGVATSGVALVRIF